MKSVQYQIAWSCLAVVLVRIEREITEGAIGK